MTWWIVCQILRWKVVEVWLFSQNCYQTCLMALAKEARYDWWNSIRLTSFRISSTATSCMFGDEYPEQKIQNSVM